MWNKISGRWTREKDVSTIQDFSRFLNRLKKYQKCLSASAYSYTHDLKSIYNTTNYRSGFYVQIIAPELDVLEIDGILIEQGEIYNLALLLSKTQILASRMDAEIQDPAYDDVPHFKTSIRRAISQGFIKAANNYLYTQAEQKVFWDAYLAPDYYDQDILDSYFGTSGTAGLNNQVILSANYTAEQIYNVAESNLQDFELSQSFYFTPDEALDKFLSNFHIVEVATTQEIDLNQEYFTLEIDGIVVQEADRILVKNQIDTTQNGIYEFHNRFLVRSSILDEPIERSNFSCFVKRGNQNQEQQFFIKPNPDGTFDSEHFDWIEGKNYILRNRVSYNLLSNLSWNQIEQVEERSPVLEPNFKFDWSVWAAGSNWKIGNNRNWIFKDDQKIGHKITNTQNQVIEVPLNTIFRLRTVDDNIFYVHQENDQWKLFQLTNSTPIELFNLNEEIKNFSNWDLVDFDLDSRNYWFILRNDNQTRLYEYDLNGANNDGVPTLGSVNLDYQISEFDVTEVNNQKFYFLVTEQGLVQWQLNQAEQLLDNRPISHLTTTIETDEQDEFLRLRYLDQTTYRPVSIRINLADINNWTNWQTSDQFKLLENFSKIEQKDFKIQDNSLFLKNADILSVTAIQNVPKINSFEGRYFDGKDDYVDFGSLTFNNVKTFSIELQVTPKAQKANTRIFHFSSPLDSDLQYDLIEFVQRDLELEKPKFVLKTGNSEIVVVANQELPLNQTTLLTIVVEMNSTSNVVAPWTWKISLWFDAILVAQESGQFIKSLAEFETFTNTYLGRSTSNLDPLFIGEMREFRISNIALNAAQISTRKRALNTSERTWTNLLYYWPLLDQTGQINERKNSNHATFKGGLFFDPDLQLIENPRQILIDQNQRYLYVLAQNPDDLESTSGIVDGTSGVIIEEPKDPNKPEDWDWIPLPYCPPEDGTNGELPQTSGTDGTDGAGTNGTAGSVVPNYGPSAIFRIDLNLEDIDVLYKTNDSINSIYVDQNTLYWLQDETIFSYGNPIVQEIETPQALDFCVVNGLELWVNAASELWCGEIVIGNQLYPAQVVAQNLDVQRIQSMWGYYQTETAKKYYNVYVRYDDNSIEIFSNTLTAGQQDFQSRGVWPFDSNSDLIVQNNRVFRVQEEQLIDLDPHNQFWNWNNHQVFAAVETTNNIFIGNLNAENKIEIWQITNNEVKKLNLGNLNLFDYQIENLDLDVFETGGTFFLVLFSPNNQVILIDLQKINQTPNFNLIDLQTFGSLHQIKMLEQNQFLWASIQEDGSKWIGSALNPDSIKFWESDLQYAEESWKFFAGDFGMFVKQAGTSGENESLQLLNPYVKWDINSISLEREQEINNQNFLDVKFGHFIWLFGNQGNAAKSEDRGQTWKSINIDTRNNLNASDFWNRNLGLVVGDNQTILSSSNGGETFEFVHLPDFDNSNFNDIIIWSKNNAIVVGDFGIILHLVFDGNVWKLSENIYNIDQDLEQDPVYNNQIKALIKDNEEFINSEINFSKILFQKETSTFWLFGDKNLIVKLQLSFQNSAIIPTFKFFETQITELQIQDARIFKDPEDGIEKILLISQDQLWLFAEQGSSEMQENMFTVQLRNITDPTHELRSLNWDSINQQVIVGGTQNKIDFISWPETNLSEFDPDLSRFFKPKMLFVDYGIARKISTTLSDGTFVKAHVDIPKNILNCYEFASGESVEFKAHSASGLGNYLHYQDWNYTTRRITQFGEGMEGQVKTYPYNKRFTSVDDMTNYKWQLNGNHYLTLSGARRTNKQYGLQNELYQPLNPNDYNQHFPERQLHTVLYVENKNFTCAAGDILELEISRTSVDGFTQLEWNPVLFKEKFIVKWVEERTNYKVIVFWDLLDSDLIQDFNPVSYNNSNLIAGYPNWTLKLENLNYFNRTLFDLQNQIERHFIGEAYKLIINQPEFLRIESSNQKFQNYFNQEAEVVFNTQSVDDSEPQDRVFEIAYDEHMYYGPNYNLEDFLVNLHPIFENYEFNWAQTFTGTLNPISGPNNLEFSNNLIYAGANLISNLEQFKAGTFVNISRGSKTIERVLILNSEIVTFEDVEVPRLKLTLDTRVDSIGRLDDTSTNNIIIEPRTLLSQISSDLNLTDNFNANHFASDSSQIGSSNLTYFNLDLVAHQYAKIIAADTNIQKYASGIIWIDEDRKMRMNVFNWSDDPNFALRPLEIFEVAAPYTDLQLFDYRTEPMDILRPAILKSMKQAIAVDEVNWKINENIFGIENLDFNQFSYTLTDGLTLSRLNSDYQWILNADIRDAILGEEEVISQITNDAGESISVSEWKLKWYNGEWLCGEWQNGRWYSGTAYDIEWLDGDWFNGGFKNDFNVYSTQNDTDQINSIWLNGNWYGGNWHGGVWYNGTFQAGTFFDGEWLGGTFLNGNWRNGEFKGGKWLNGNWFDGVFSSNFRNSTWYGGNWYGGDFLNGVWKNGIWDQIQGKVSRFGIGATLIRPAIWEFGVWRNGEFHAGENATKNFKNSRWYNGIWYAGTWYGGIWRHGVWHNGTWNFGIWQKELQYEAITKVETGAGNIATHIRFTEPHYFKETRLHLDLTQNIVNPSKNLILNTITILGEPDVSSSFLPAMCQNLGWNSFPRTHAIKIIDDYTIALQFLDTSVDRGYYRDYFVDGAAELISAAQSDDDETCPDPTIVPEPEPAVHQYTLTEYSKGPQIVSKWNNGTWNQGIWFNGYWNNGNFIGGNWLNGVFERGNFGN